jgi:hypothetical protein
MSRKRAAPNREMWEWRLVESAESIESSCGFIYYAYSIEVVEYHARNNRVKAYFLIQIGI